MEQVKGRGMASGAQRKVNWFLVAGGVVLVLCGAAIFCVPGFFLEFLTIGAGIGFLISGIAGIGSYVRVRAYGGNAGFHLFMAILDVLVGFLLIAYPFVFVGFLPWMLGVGFVLFGIAEIAGLMPFSRVVPETRTIAIISGVLSTIVGIMFIVWPASLSIWVAAFVLVRGITLVASGIMSGTVSRQ